MEYQILRLKDVVSKTGLSRSTIYERIKNNEFPQPLGLGARAIGFIQSEVDDWIEARIYESRNGDSRSLVI
jgi:prophage regulatory protein